MIGKIKKEILIDLDKIISILEKDKNKDFEELRRLSTHTINDVAIYKDLELISITVLIYSIYKIAHSISSEGYKNLLAELKFAHQHLSSNNLGRYNKSIRTLFTLIKKSNAKVRIHLQDVLQAAKIKKSSELYQHGLSIGQAAGLMGLSNWDLQQYLGSTTLPGTTIGKMSASKRFAITLKIFGVNT